MVRRNFGPRFNNSIVRDAHYFRSLQAEEELRAAFVREQQQLDEGRRIRRLIDEFIGAPPADARRLAALGLDLNGLTEALRGIDLSALDLSGCVFTRSDLTGANVAGVVGCRADFSEAKLKELKAPAANFSRAVFRRADLSDADLRNADLTNCDFSGALLDGVDFSGACVNLTALESAASRRSMRLPDGSFWVAPRTGRVIRSSGAVRRRPRK